jgi:hypothetical protein
MSLQRGGQEERATERQTDRGERESGRERETEGGSVRSVVEVRLRGTGDLSCGAGEPEPIVDEQRDNALTRGGERIWPRIQGRDR